MIAIKLYLITKVFIDALIYSRINIILIVNLSMSIMENKMSIDEVKLEDKERQPCEVWTRVMGYHRPVSEFNKGKKEEFKERKCFVEEKAVENGQESRTN